MTDMHREAFERWFEDKYGTNFTIGEYRRACESWQAALRYRDEQEKGMETEGDRISAQNEAFAIADAMIAARDEQEKQA